MKQASWKAKARAEGRVCPECLQPVSKECWNDMQTKKGIRTCWSCRYVHWEMPLQGHCGNVFEDNAGREAFTQEMET